MADCAAAVAHGEECTLTYGCANGCQPGYSGGFVTCDTATGLYVAKPASGEFRPATREKLQLAIMDCLWGTEHKTSSDWDLQGRAEAKPPDSEPKIAMDWTLQTCEARGQARPSVPYLCVLNRSCPTRPPLGSQAWNGATQTWSHIRDWDVTAVTDFSTSIPGPYHCKRSLFK